jgi:hypothetical protein
LSMGVLSVGAGGMMSGGGVIGEGSRVGGWLRQHDMAEYEGIFAGDPPSDLVIGFVYNAGTLCTLQCVVISCQALIPPLPAGNEIDFDTLPYLTETDLITMGIKAVGPRRKLLTLCRTSHAE